MRADGVFTPLRRSRWCRSPACLRPRRAWPRARGESRSSPRRTRTATRSSSRRTPAGPGPERDFLTVALRALAHLRLRRRRGGGSTWYAHAWLYKNAYGLQASELDGPMGRFVLRDADGSPMYLDYACGADGACPQYALDITNPEYRAAWIAELRDRQLQPQHSGHLRRRRELRPGGVRRRGRDLLARPRPAGHDRALAGGDGRGSCARSGRRSPARRSCTTRATRRPAACRRRPFRACARRDRSGRPDRRRALLHRPGPDARRGRFGWEALRELDSATCTAQGKGRGPRPRDRRARVRAGHPSHGRDRARLLRPLVPAHAERLVERGAGSSTSALPGARRSMTRACMRRDFERGRRAGAPARARRRARSRSMVEFERARRDVRRRRASDVLGQRRAGWCCAKRLRRGTRAARAS